MGQILQNILILSQKHAKTIAVIRRYRLIVSSFDEPRIINTMSLVKQENLGEHNKEASLYFFSITVVLGCFCA